MNADLLKAERELARGNPDEARIHAWNALATVKPEELGRLLEVAEELGDSLLIRELERRGLSAEPHEAKPSFRLRSLIFPAVVATILLLLAVNTVTAEPGAPKLTEKDTAFLTGQGAPLLTQRSGVWIVRLGRSELVPLQKLADDLSLRYRIPVGVLPAIEAFPPSVLDGDRLKGDDLEGLIARTYTAEGRATIIGITDYDMFSTALDLEHPFMLRWETHYGVVSTADLAASLIDRLRGHTRYERTRKLVARGIGFLYLRRPPSADPHSLLRSQMSGTGDIDALDERL